ncbi:flagellar hook-basal body complex protein [Asticcacaulis sp.]|uniref:flagellar hook protein FlgE n=1 Tax=Asticcacaulis sp. TaxID=1872648 RepID=UPI002BF8F6F1|nr:flagellar hook-basal body complex protein [Asticcacaulis sp.]HTM80792.1 flagellar hook-basal body complex protein [Asticcacaulis sp.]
MSINSAMQSGVTALAANATALATISNNIANSNTTGFKRVLTNFTDLVSGSNNKNSFSSGGVVSVNRQNNTAQGELNSNTSGYSLGINGQGFFVVSEKPEDLTSGSSLLFTRDGSFTTDTKGNLVNSGGYYLQGWPADSSGNISTSATNVNLLAPINVSDLANSVEATTAVNFVANLDARTTISDAVNLADNDPTTFDDGPYNATTAVTASDMTTTPPTYSAAMSIYDPATGAGTKPDSTITSTVSDSLGQEHTITISLLKGNVDTDNTTPSPTYGMTRWYYEVSSADVDSDNGLNQIDTGSIYFDSKGKLVKDPASYGGTLPKLLSDTGFSIGASSADVTVAPRWKTAVGAEGQDISMGFGAAGSSNITQTSGDSTTVSVKANGTEFGTLSKVEVGADGIVKAIYNNGNTRTLAQVALATFLNANGLTAVSGNAYQVSTDSGAYLLKTPGENGAGSIEADTLEASTVDLAQEFTGLITTQRAYSAASKIVTTADDMLQELLAIKR